jgi:hypothetical protein
MSLFKFLGNLFEILPIQGRTERWKNEIDQLTKEKDSILKGDCSVKTTKRYNYIKSRIDELNRLLKNKT